MLKQADVDVLVLKLKELVSLGMMDPKAEHLKREISPVLNDMTEEIAHGQVEPGVQYKEIVTLVAASIMGETITTRLRQAISR